jgi:hypothetical protein
MPNTLLFILLVLIMPASGWAEEARLDFNHKKHLAFNIGCGECHTNFVKGMKAGMPSKSTCFKCHKNSEPLKKLLRGYFSKDGQFIESERKSKQSILVPHKKHTFAGVSCTVCHQGIKENTSIFQLKRAEHSTCYRCHEAKKNDCAMCHQGGTGGKLMPENHKKNWKKFHGQAASDGGHDLSKNECMKCHTKNSCTQCHQQEAPRNHTNFWRQTGHGKHMKVDRVQCMTCHQTNSCNKCHQETRPRSHRGNWGSRTNRHCISCHLQDDQSSCTTCHRAMPSHLNATPIPGNPAHVTASSSDCRTCHVPFKTHIDNGDDCRFCHK